MAEKGKVYVVKERGIEGTGPAINRKFDPWKKLEEFNDEGKAIKFAKERIKLIINRKELKQVSIFLGKKKIKTFNVY